MKLVPQILAAYNDIDGYLNSRLNDAASSKDVAAQKEISERRVYNDNAYFVLLWGQLENEINDTCFRLISRRKAKSTWHARRMFYNLDPDRMKFEDRLSLLVDKQAGRGSPWATCISHYMLRNKIAHGESDLSGVSIPAIVGELYRIQAALRA